MKLMLQSLWLLPKGYMDYLQRKSGDPSCWCYRTAAAEVSEA